MPFEPELIHPEEPPLQPSGELQLPADLQELAAQLGDDAAYLANLFPPRSVPKPQAESGNNTSRLRLGWRLGAAACITALCVGGVYFWRGQAEQAVAVQEFAPPIIKSAEPKMDSPPPVQTATPLQFATASLDPFIRSLPGEEAPGAERTFVAPANASPAQFLHEFSGPELEGLYDLLGDSEEDKISI